MMLDNKITMPSGAEINAVDGFLGIAVHGKDDQQNRFVLSTGKDDWHSVFDSKEDFKRHHGSEYSEDGVWNCGDMVLAAEDRKFLAELMIARWQEFGGIKEA
jgi:hypothetical protein